MSKITDRGRPTARLIEERNPIRLTDSLWKSHTPQQVFKSSVGTKIFKRRHNIYEGQDGVPLFINLFEPFKGKVFLAGNRVALCHSKLVNRWFRDRASSIVARELSAQCSQRVRHWRLF